MRRFAGVFISTLPGPKTLGRKNKTKHIFLYLAWCNLEDTAGWMTLVLQESHISDKPQTIMIYWLIIHMLTILNTDYWWETLTGRTSTPRLCPTVADQSGCCADEINSGLLRIGGQFDSPDTCLLVVSVCSSPHTCINLGHCQLVIKITKKMHRLCHWLWEHYKVNHQ